MAVAARQLDNEILMAAEAAALSELDECRDCCEYFVEEYVRIENMDAAGAESGLAVPFTLWDGQRDALRAFLLHRMNIALKARQLGLTWLALAFAVWSMIFKPGYVVVALSKRDSDAKELVRRVKFILSHLPSWMIRPEKSAAWIGPTWSATTEAVIINHPGKDQSKFQSMPASQDSGRSFTANLLLLDEWAFQQWAREIWSAGYPTINRPTGGQVIGISTGKRGTLYEEIWNAACAGMNQFNAIFLPWWTDPRRTDEWYAQVQQDLPHAYRAEYPATPADAFTVGEGAAFPEWDERVHIAHQIDWYPPPGARIYRAYDGGFMSNACCKWYAVLADGNAVCYREYYPHMVTDEDQADMILKLSRDPDGLPETIVQTIGDPACWQKRGTVENGDTAPKKKVQKGVSTADIFLRKGIPMVPANNDRINGWRRLHTWLKHYTDGAGIKTARLTFTQACANTIRTYPSIEMDKHIPEDINTDNEDHCQDVDRYFVMSRPRPGESAEEAKARQKKAAASSKPVRKRTGY